MHQGYKIYAKKILEDHKLALYNDPLTHKVPIPPAELPEINTLTTITTLTFLQTQNEEVINIHT